MVAVSTVKAMQGGTMLNPVQTARVFRILVGKEKSGSRRCNRPIPKAN